MKLIFISLLVLILSITTSHDPSKDRVEIPTCDLEMNKTDLRKGLSNLTCNGMSFKDVYSYKIKFPRKPTQVMRGSELNFKVKSYISTSRIGDRIVIFDIIIDTSKKDKETPLRIKVIE